ncbi:MAG: hypothetical protein K2J73_13290 [Oscillospiraceae bacterium]|nr:hypothetical protein [Oscillospiraceae bacterium]
MDINDFSFDALLECDVFARYESIETRCAMNSLFEYIEKNVSDVKTVNMIHGALSDCRSYIFNDAFKQGFCFAVKTIKFMLKI